MGQFGQHRISMCPKVPHVPNVSLTMLTGDWLPGVNLSPSPKRYSHSPGLWNGSSLYAGAKSSVSNRVKSCGPVKDHRMLSSVGVYLVNCSVAV